LLIVRLFTTPGDILALTATLTRRIFCQTILCDSIL